MTRHKRTRQQRVFDRSYTEDLAARGKYALEQMVRMAAGTHPERNPMRQLALFKRHVPALEEYMLMVSEVRRNMFSMLMMETPNERLAWSQDEDEALVDGRTRGVPFHLIASGLGRTPAACATRLSTLTGIPRSQIVEAYIEGTLDHETEVRGLFTGQVRKLPAAN